LSSTSSRRERPRRLARAIWLDRGLGWIAVAGVLAARAGPVAGWEPGPPNGWLRHTQNRPALQFSLQRPGREMALQYGFAG
jgi:hypothetical protein